MGCIQSPPAKPQATSPPKEEAQAAAGIPTAEVSKTSPNSSSAASNKVTAPPETSLLPVVAVFPATSKTGLATLRRLTSWPFRNSCSKIVCVLKDESGIQKIRKELGNAVTDSLAFSFANYDDEFSMVSAFVGCDRILIVSPSTENSAEQACQAGIAAKNAGVKQVVFLSVQNAHHEAIYFAKNSRKVETFLENLETVSYTHLRCSYFMENFFPMIYTITNEGCFYSSWGDGEFSPVCVDDIGHCAAAILSCSNSITTHFNKIYDITGPETMTGRDMAVVFSQVLKKPIDYRDLSREKMKEDMLSYKTPEWLAEALVELNEYYKEGKAATVTQTVAKLTNGIHTTFKRFVQNYRYLFRNETSPLFCVLPGSSEIGRGAISWFLNTDSTSARILAVVKTEEKKAKLEEEFANDTRLSVQVADLEDVESLRKVLLNVDRLAIIP